MALEDITPELRAVIQRQVEGTKKLLSKKANHSINISYDGDVTRIEISADAFKERTQDLVEMTMDFVRQILENNSLTAADIDVVLLVGGSTKMPMIREAVETVFAGKVRMEDHPDLAVAKGAALKAALECVERVLEKNQDQSGEEEDVKKAVGMEVMMRCLISRRRRPSNFAK